MKETTIDNIEEVKEETELPTNVLVEAPPNSGKTEMTVEMAEEFNVRIDSAIVSSRVLIEEIKNNFIIVIDDADKLSKDAWSKIKSLHGYELFRVIAFKTTGTTININEKFFDKILKVEGSEEQQIHPDVIATIEEEIIDLEKRDFVDSIQMSVNPKKPKVDLEVNLVSTEERKIRMDEEEESMNEIKCSECVYKYCGELTPPCSDCDGEKNFQSSYEEELVWEDEIDEEAKEEIKEWLKETNKDPVYNSDIFEVLEIPYEKVQRIVNELCDEGYLISEKKKEDNQEINVVAIRTDYGCLVWIDDICFDLKHDDEEWNLLGVLYHSEDDEIIPEDGDLDTIAKEVEDEYKHYKVQIENMVFVLFKWRGKEWVLSSVYEVSPDESILEGE